MTFDDDEPAPPPGVTLRDPEDSDATRKAIEDGVMNSMQRYVHGFSYGGVRMELSDMKYADKEKFSLADQKEALLSDRLLHRRLRGTVRLVDDETGDILDTKKNLTLARVPYLTQRGTFVNNGSEFSPVSQSRLLPGAYTRRRDNGELETHFNVRPGTGSAMRMTFDPGTAQYRLKLGSSDLHAYSFFKDIGVSDEELERRWGKDILETNRAKYSRHTVDRAYKKAVPKWERDDSLPVIDKVREVRNALGRAQVARNVLKRNLPNLYSQEKAAHWRKAGAAVDMAQQMVKRAAQNFEPDMSPGQIVDQWTSFFGSDLEKMAEFDPDLAPSDMRETYNSIYGQSGPQLASMRAWPKHWLDDQDSQGWLQWYENYHAGRRSDNDEKQKQRWKSFKSRHGSQFVAKPTPRRAFALQNWGIDPLKMLPEDQVGPVKSEMEGYRRKEFVKWFMNRHDFDDDAAERLGRKAVGRGATVTDTRPGDRELMSLALDGFIEPEDLK